MEMEQATQHLVRVFLRGMVGAITLKEAAELYHVTEKVMNNMLWHTGGRKYRGKGNTWMVLNRSLADIEVAIAEGRFDEIKKQPPKRVEVEVGTAGDDW